MPQLKAHEMICPDCKGWGVIRLDVSRNKLIYTKAHKCYKCNGYGKITNHNYRKE